MGEIIVESPLTVSEKQRLTDLETVIKDNFLGFVAVGKALAEIRDRRLYRNSDGRTFEGYCAEIWEVSRRRAYQLIDASTVAENVKNFSQTNTQLSEFIIPQNEAQASELAKLPPEEQPVVWQQVVKKAEEKGGRITAKLTRDTVRSHLGEAISKKVKEGKKALRKNTTDKQSASFAEAWELFWSVVLKEREANWRHTSKKIVLDNITALADLLADDIRADTESPGCEMAMSDREKLLQAGFKIFRMNRKVQVIEEYRSDGKWIVVQSCHGYKDLVDAFNELMKDQKNLRA